MTPEAILSGALDPLAAALDRYGQQKVAMSVADLARAQHLSDVRETRSYEENVAEAASKRRMKEDAERERLRAVEMAAAMGVAEVTPEDSLQDVAKKVRGFRKDQAQAGLDIMDAQMRAAQANQQAKLKSAIAAVNSDRMGTAEQRRMALQATLSNASVVDGMPDGVVRELRQIVASGQDPAKAIQQTVEKMQESGSKLFAFLPGVHTPGTWRDRAQNFFQSYMQNLSPSVDQSRQVELAAAMSELTDANRQVETIVSKTAGHLEANAGLLPEDVRKQWVQKIGPPANPASLLPGKPRVPATVGTGTTGTPNVSVPPVLVAPPSAMGMAASAITGRDMGGTGDWLSSPIPKQDVVASRVQADLRQNPRPAPLPATPQEVEAVRRMAADEYGMTADRQAMGEQKIQAGDPEAVASFNVMLRQVRARQMGVPANVPPSTEDIGMSMGGIIRGRGTSTSDSIPIKASVGEFVVNAATVRQPGVLAMLQRLNRQYGDDAKRFAEGGLITSPTDGSSLAGTFSEIGLGIMKTHPKLRPDNWSELPKEAQQSYADLLGKTRIKGVIKLKNGSLFDLSQKASEIPTMPMSKFDKMTEDDKRAWIVKHGGFRFPEEEFNAGVSTPEAPYQGGIANVYHPQTVEDMSKGDDVYGGDYIQLPSGEWGGSR